MLNQRRLAVWWLVLASAWLPWAAYGQLDRIVGQPEELRISADTIEHDQASGRAVARGKVKIDYGNLTLTADEASVNQTTNDFAATGNVVIATTGGVT